jgi:hypothetical protein
MLRPASFLRTPSLDAKASGMILKISMLARRAALVGPSARRPATRLGRCFESQRLLRRRRC